MNISFIEKKIIDIPKDIDYEPCLIENNKKQIGEICEFLQSNDKIMLVNGFLGTGKTTLLNFIITQLKEDVLPIKYSCFETTVLDDMLLSFFDSFRSFALQGKITPPKIKVENFTQKINSYFNSIETPIFIVIDNFNTILKTNKPDILNFIKHLTNFKNIKIVLVSRAFNYEDFENFEFAQSTILAFSKDIFEKFLKNNDIKNIGVISNELYKQTKGYYHYINLSVKIMKLRGYNIVKFLESHSKSLLSFHEFVNRDALSMVDPVSLHLFRLLALMRIPIHVNLLKSLHIFNPESVKFFLKNSILASEGEFIYLPDYYREIIENQIQDTVMIKLHKACVELYETQLPLKPLERDLRLSRQTMRNEIDYHSLFLPKKPVIPQNIEQPLLVKQPEIKEPEVKETKEEQIQKINFIVEDESILNNIADSIVDFVNEKTQKIEFIQKSTTLSLTQLLNSAKQEENSYNFKSAAILYQNALTKKDDDNFDTFLPTIYLKLAQTYKNMSQWYEALEYLTKAQDYYFNVSNENKVCEIKLDIANIYFEIYKHDNAKYILQELEKNPNLSNELRIKVYLALGKLAENLNIEFDYYRKSIPLIDRNTDKTTACELYYRLAGVYDEKDDTKNAVLYYKKCIETEQNPKINNFIAKAYANIADLFDEIGNSQNAIIYYKKSLEIDLSTKNYNGLYTNSRHLSELYSSKDEKLSLEYLKQACEYAKQLNEPFYMTDINMEIGNYYLLRQDFENSYNYFIQAYEISKNSLSKDNTDKIISKINYVKNLVKNNG